jgi:hypothetical protein
MFFKAVNLKMLYSSANDAAITYPILHLYLWEDFQNP